MDNRKTHIDSLGAVLLVSFSALLGLNQVLVKLVNVGLDPVFQAGLRSACAFLPVLIFAIIMRRRLSLSDGSLIPGIATGLLFSAEFTLLFTALDYTSVSRASVLFYTMPFWVVIGAHFLVPDQRLTPLKCAGLVLAVAGVFIVLGGNANQNSDQALFGDFLCLLSALCWAGITLVIRTTSLSRAVPEMQLLYQLAVSALILLGVAVFYGEFIRAPTAVIWAIFTFQVLVVVATGFLVWIWVISIYPLAQMAMFSFLAPVFGVFLSWLILNEPITWHVLLSLILIAVGIVLVNWYKQDKQQHAG